MPFRPGSSAPSDGGGTELEAALRARVRGEVRFSDGDRALYATDASNYRQVPIGVVVPADEPDLRATLEVCREHGAPVLPRGGGTSLAGQCCNAAVVLDTSKHLRRIVEIDPDARTARVQPGVVLDHLRGEAERFGLTFGPDPATHDRCTIGGMLGNNSCGIHSVMAGQTKDNVESLRVVTGDGVELSVGRTSDEDLERECARPDRVGELHRSLRSIRDRWAGAVRERFPDIPRRVSGYGLEQLLPEHGFDLARALVGSEGTCVTILEATVRLVESPPERALLVLGYPDVFAAADAVPDLLRHEPIGLEGIDRVLVSDMHRTGLHPDDLELLPEGDGWLLVEFGADTPAEAEARAREVADVVRRSSPAPNADVYTDAERRAAVWEVRESGLGATARVPGKGDTWPGWEDSAVHPERLGDYLRALQELYDRYRYGGALYGHFGQGCIHTRIDFDLVTAEGIARFRSFVQDAAETVLGFGGSLSGEHGDGQARGELLERMFGGELVDAFRAFKLAWDPEGRMNPGKVVDARPLDRDLRLGVDYDPTPVRTAFAFPDDGGSFERASMRCVGVGLCRRESGGVMCPSYMATLEEKHSTRGRARLLFEMLRGDPVQEGWRAEAVHDALDLCLSCKGCKRECPVDVDMATYKAEFLHHHYRGRLRPRTAYAMGLIPWSARLASLAPALANAAVGGGPTEWAAKRLAGIAPERRIPRFAPRSFTRSFRSRRPHEPDTTPATDVILWADTFTEHFHPEVAWAAVHVLRGAGHRVSIPGRWLCCGRPLYDFGMLDLAKRTLRRVLETLRPAIRAGTPIVGLEPSCVSVFRDELVELFPDDQDAVRLSRQTFTLAELLGRDQAWEPPALQGRALVQAHCHHRSIMGFEPDEELLRRTGLDVEVLDSGCCGMAGAFGFEREHYEVSMACGERVLLPAVREADRDTVIVADGFSCREQIEQGAGRRPFHLAEVLAGRHVVDRAGKQHAESPRGRGGRP